jgi:hypothetical protein
MTFNFPDLFVSWRSHASGRIYPVGRLSWHDLDKYYEFAYIQNADEAITDGFSPFTEFPALENSYRSTILFPMFSNRVMPISRKDFPELLQVLRLSPSTAHPMAILARTGGTRQTDKIEMFPRPSPDATPGFFTTYFLLRSLRYMEREMTEARISTLRTNEELYLKPDLQNPKNSRALRIFTNDDCQLGYLPDYLVDDVHLLNESNGEARVVVEQVNHPPIGAHHRLLCKLIARWPEGFNPYSSPAYEPYQPRTLATIAV